jgi:acyl-CoA reductase-like NAD-dependent aldehyde dehydrogenase
VHNELFIDGAFRASSSRARLPVINPFDESTITEIAEGRAEDIDQAVEAAEKAFPKWRSTPASDRGRLLLRLADALEANAEEFAQLESLNTGHPIRDSRTLDVPRTAACFRYFGGIADKLQGDVIPVDTGFLNYVVREPLGVVGAIVPWNFPLMFCSWKLGPALAAGNTAVLKPSEITPLTSLRLAALMKEVGFPDGVINVVPGFGNTAGERLALHPRVAKIAFTGSTAVGKRIVASSASNVKRVQLELGGKGANIVFEDANVTAAINGSAWAIFHNQGQACIAGSRLILHSAIADEFIERFIGLARSIRLGNPLLPDTEMGPLTSAMHRDRVLNYVKVAKDEGAEILTGGQRPQAAAFERGFFVEPTVVRVRSHTDRVCQEEVFGPFVTVSTFDSDDEALEIANSTDYALGGGLWTQNLARAHRISGELRSGMVWVNSYKRVHPGSPFGGFGLSGYGREMGFEALHDYTEPKSVWVNHSATIPAWYPRPKDHDN